MKWTARCRAGWIALLTVILLAGCGTAPSPEERIRALIAEAERAAESRDTGDVMALVAEGYTDAHGQGREELRRYLRALFLRYQSIHLLVRVSTIKVIDDRATATLFVAMAGQPLTEADLPLLRADAHRLDLHLVNQEGDWVVAHAAWRRASREDLLGRPVTDGT